MIRMVCAATNSANSSRMTSAISATTMGTSGRGGGGSWGHHGSRAADLDDLHLGAGRDDHVVVVGAGRPDLAPDPHGSDALVVGDALEHDRVAADQRRGAGADLRRMVEVALGDGPDE